MQTFHKLRAKLSDDIVRLGIIAVFFIVMPIASPYFFNMRNMMNILQNFLCKGLRPFWHDHGHHHRRH